MNGRRNALLSGAEIDALQAYLVTGLVANLVWESAQMPLYTLWETGARHEIAFAVVHCAAGDLLIGASALALAVLLSGRPEADKPRQLIRIGAVTIFIGLVYTLFSEWLNTEIRQSWAYGPAMPVLPWLGTGLSPILQWVLIPLVTLWRANRALVADLMNTR